MKLALALLATMLFQSSEVPVRPIDAGGQSGVEESRQLLVTTPAAFAALWREHSPRPQPSVDFTRESVVGIFLGMRNTAGYSVAIASVTRDRSGLLVRYREHAPAADAITAQVLSFPYALVAIPAAAPPVRFEAVR
jgi:hypothetical protein